MWIVNCNVYGFLILCLRKFLRVNCCLRLMKMDHLVQFLSICLDSIRGNHPSPQTTGPAHSRFTSFTLTILQTKLQAIVFIMVLEDVRTFFKDKLACGFPFPGFSVNQIV